jgi:hypothetical protein
MSLEAIKPKTKQDKNKTKQQQNKTRTKQDKNKSRQDSQTRLLFSMPEVGEH